MFQLAKGLETLLKEVRSALQLPPLTVISQGPAKKTLFEGRLCRTADIYSCCEGDHPAASLVVCLDQADGTEEIPESVAAVILKH